MFEDINFNNECNGWESTENDIHLNKGATIVKNQGEVSHLWKFGNILINDYEREIILNNYRNGK